MYGSTVSTRPFSSVKGIICDFDADSKTPGSTGNKPAWSKIFKDIVGYEIGREWGHLVGPSLQLICEEIISKNMKPLLLGGGHSLSYFSIAAIYRRYGELNILHFDAHHDRYESNLLCHYTVFHRLQQDFKVNILPVGHRFELEKASPLLRDISIDKPWYVSLDVDYFTPTLVNSVIHPVGTETSDFKCDINEFCNFLSSVDAPIVGADIVEWISHKSDIAEAGIVIEACKYLLERMEK